MRSRFILLSTLTHRPYSRFKGCGISSGSPHGPPCPVSPAWCPPTGVHLEMPLWAGGPRWRSLGTVTWPEPLHMRHLVQASNGAWGGNPSYRRGSRGPWALRTLAPKAPARAAELRFQTRPGRSQQGQQMVFLAGNTVPALRPWVPLKGACGCHLTQWRRLKNLPPGPRGHGGSRDVGAPIVTEALQGRHALRKH